MVGVLAGGGSLPVAVGVSDMWQLTDDRQHMIGDTFFLLFFWYQASTSVGGRGGMLQRG